MKKTAVSALFLLSITVKTLAQEVANKVNQLVDAENYFAALVKQKGIREAFLKVSDENTILFRPGPVKAYDFFKEKTAPDSGSLNWHPVYARISKSDDWGFTTGPYIYHRSDTSGSAYGDYLSVWKKNRRGIWKLALDIGIAHKKPKIHPELSFINPSNAIFLHQQSRNRLQEREDIVLSSDKLYATILHADNKIGRNEFLSDDVRLLFPGHEPVTGKSEVLKFWQKQNVKLTSEPVHTDRAYSGELAYTYGNAIITSAKGTLKNYYYLRIWQLQEGFKWNVIMEIFTAED